MSSIHNQLSRGPFGKALKNAVGDSKGEGALERYGETLQPVIDLWTQPEWRYLLDDQLWAASAIRAADAANAGIVGVSLPAASKAIVIVEGVSGRNAVATGSLALSMLDRVTLAALAGFTLLTPPFFRDQRADAVIGAQRAPLELFTAVTGTVPTLNSEAEQLSFPVANEFRQFRSPPYIVRPGGGLFVQSEAINQQIRVNFWGRVRFALPTETKTF